MTKEEALELFDINDDTTKEEITQKYRELYSEYGLRLTNAPTPHLKKMYSQNLQKLDEALKFLCPDAEMDESQFLPTDKPILESSNTSPNINISISNQVGPKQEEKQPKTIKKKSSKLPIIISSISLLFFAIGISAIIVFFKREKIIIEKEKIISEKNLVIEKLKSDSIRMLLTYYPIIENKKLKIINKSKSSITITSMSVLYLDADHIVRSISFYTNIVIPTGGKNSKPIEYHDKNNNWSGDVLYYSLNLSSGTIYSGIISQAIDENGYLVLTEE